MAGTALLELNKSLYLMKRLVKGESTENVKMRNFALLQGVTEIKPGAVGATAVNGCIWPLLTAIDVLGQTRWPWGLVLWPERLLRNRK